VGHAVPGRGAVLALVVRLSADQLHVRPLHRLVHRHLAHPPGDAVEGDLSEAARQTASIVIATEPGRGISVAVPEGTQPATHLHETLLPGLGVDPADLDYEAHADRVAGAMAGGATAFYLPPVTIDDIAAVAKAGERLPEKTTFFSPKPRTGLVFRSLLES